MEILRLARAPRTQPADSGTFDTVPTPSVVTAPAAPRFKHKWYVPGWIALGTVAVTTALSYGLWLAAFGTARLSLYAHLTRVTAFVSYALLTLAIVFGVIVASRWGAYAGAWLVVERMHPLFLLVSGMFLSFHLAALLINHFSPLVAFVPFVPSNRVVRAGMGILAMYLMIALTLSTYLIRRIGFKAWRTLHWAGFIAWLAATGHGILAGSDTGALWARLFYACSATLVASSIVLYVVRHGSGALVGAQADRSKRQGAPTG